MTTFGDWYAEATREVPRASRLIDECYGDLLGGANTAPPRAGFPWNTQWRDGVGAPSWLLNLFRSRAAEEVAEDWVRSGALLPTPEEGVVLEVARQFSARVATVFLLHGNVRDYVFDAHLGFAPLAEVLQSYWVDTGLYLGGVARPEAAALRYGITEGVVLERHTPGGATSEQLAQEITAHRQRVASLDQEQRVYQDFAFLSELLDRDRDPPILLYFERPVLLFAGGTDHLRTSSWLEHVLRWAEHAPRRDCPGDRDVTPSRRFPHLVILAADTLEDLNPELRKRVNGVALVEVARPARGERRRMLAASMAACGPGGLPLAGTRLAARELTLPFDVTDLDRLAEITAGLNYKGIESCLLNILERNVGRGEVLDFLKSERSALIRAESEGLLEVIEPRFRLDDLVGGLESVRARLDSIIAGMVANEGTPARALVPTGVLFVGPPGTGKSLTAEGLAHACAQSGVHYVRMGDFRDMWVGQSERNFSRILGVLETFGRVIVFMDELDQTEGGSRSMGSQHETSRRIFGKLLAFMASPRHRGRILWIAATNRPGLLDPALLRPGRFDFILPFDLPDAAGCRCILDIMLDHAPVTNDVSPGAREAAAALMARKHFSGAEIQLVVTEAARRAIVAGRAAFTDEDLAGVAGDYEGSQKDTSDYAKMIDECRRFVPFRSMRVRPNAV